MAFFDDDAQGKKVTYNQTANPVPPPPNNNNAYNLAYAGYGAPQQAYADYQNQILNKQLGLNNAQYTTQMGYLNQQQGLQNQSNQLAQQGIDVNYNDLLRGNTRSKDDYLRSLQGWGLDVQDFNRQVPLNAQRDAIQNQMFGLQEQQSNEGAVRQQRGLASNATARGSLGSTGFGQGMNDVSQQLAESLQNLGYQRSQFGLANNERDAQLRTNAERLNQQPKDMFKDYQRNTEDTNSAITRLNQQAKQLGISQQDAKNRINQAIEQLGISRLTNADSIIQAMYSNNFNAAQSIPVDVLNAIRQLTGIPGVR